MKNVVSLLVSFVIACGGSPTPMTPASVDASLVGSDGKEVGYKTRIERSPYTVLLFFTAECPVQKAHDARLRELVLAYRTKGVEFVGVVADAKPDMAVERAEAEKRGLGIAIEEDRGSRLADALGVEFSTHVVLVDKAGTVHYSGAFDSDRTRMSERHEAYLEHAIKAVLEGKRVSTAKTEALGCPLRKH